MISVHVIIPVYGRTDALETVGRLRAASGGARLKITLVDNGNDEKIAHALESCAGPDCQVLRLERNVGGAGAFRAGLSRALDGRDSDFVWMLDDDAQVNGETLPQLVRTFQECEREGARVGAVGSAMLGRRTPDVITEVGCAVSRWKGVLRQRHHLKRLADVGEVVDEVEYVAAASLLTRVGVLRDVGLFEDVFIHLDDVDWCLRARKMGYRIFATTRSTVNHLEWEDKFADWLVYYDTRNLLWLMRRHFPLSGFLAWMKIFAHLVIQIAHGRRYPARLMMLGIRHSIQGKILMRDELPLSPVRDDFDAGHLGVRYIAVVGATGARTAAVRHSVSVGTQVLEAVYSKRKLGRSALAMLKIQYFMWFHRHALLIWDNSCVKNNPFPVVTSRKRFYYLKDGRPVIFAESK